MTAAISSHRQPTDVSTAYEINLSIFEDYLRCKYKTYLKVNGKIGETSGYEAMRSKRWQAYRANALINLSGAIQPPVSAELTSGAPLFAGIKLSQSGLASPEAVLLRERGRSSFGAHHYMPVRFVDSIQVSVEDKLSLAFEGLLLESIQERAPKYGTIIFGSDFRKVRIVLRKYMTKASRMLSEMRAMNSNGSAPPMILNAHCKMCEFRSSCRAIAIEKDHLSLLSGMTENEITRMAERGILSVTQYSYLFRARKVFKKQSHSSPLKALAVREKKIFIYGLPHIQLKPVQIFLDVEGDPSRGFDYLIGALVKTDDGMKMFSFWADDPSGERTMCRQFLNLLEGYKEFQLFHYGSYETRFLHKIKTRYSRGKARLTSDVLNNAVNILSLVYSHVYFPTYSNDLKEIGAFLGFQWTDPHASGLQSMVWRYEWEKNRDPSIKRTLVQYNADDCVALRSVAETIFKIVAGQMDEAKFMDAMKVRTAPRTFGKTDYVLPDFDYINKCAYFDYQRDKVYIRANKSPRKRHMPRRRRKSRHYRFNKVVRFPEPKRCRKCGCETLYRHHRYKRKSIDLKFTHGGIKRWVTKYHCDDYRCARCKSLMRPKQQFVIEKYGHGVISWLVYQNVVAGTPFYRMAEILRDTLDLTLNKNTLHRFKFRASTYYQVTYDRLLRKVAQGSVIYADETKVGVSQLPGYVWGFTNLEEAVFIYRETREAQFVKEWLKDFKGVLVSDFYPGYESINCSQQKCLVHLMRDLNDDLRASPFDQEFRAMTQMFATLLRGIVGTIDRFGLRRRYLHKHKREAERFLDEICSANYKSELADKFAKRFHKNRECLFTFLDHDGVSWNNNAAEHVIRHFAIYRNAASGSFTATGIRQYLVLLSIYQTCKLRNINFLKFLLSGKKDLDRYAAGGND